jgi:hypothetical protein
MDWNQSKLFKNKIKSYCLHDEVIYVIDTGRNVPPSKRFILVHDDAYEQSTGKTELLSEYELLKKYKISFFKESMTFDDEEITHPNLTLDKWSEMIVYTSPYQGELFKNALCYNFRTKTYSYYDKKYDPDLLAMDVRVTSVATERLTLKQYRLLVGYIVENNNYPDRIFIKKDEDGKNNKDELYMPSKYTEDGKILSLKPIKLSNN